MMLTFARICPAAVFKALAAALLALCLPGLALADRVALVIGNSAYQSVAALGNPMNDAEKVAAVLETQGFEVLQGHDLSRDDMRNALRQFRDMADRADIALVYYAGHGIEIGGENYLVPVDARLEDERDAELEMINLDQVLYQISGAGQMKMVVLDACRNNPFVAKVRSRSGSRSIGQGLGDIQTAEADTLIAYAAAAGAVTPDGQPGSNSPFTAAFLEAMKGPPVDVRRMLGVVRDRMRKTVPDAAPFVYTSLGGGEFIINPQNARPEPEPMAEAPAPVTPNPISKDFVDTDAKGTVAAWDAFLVTYEPQNTHPLYAFALQRRQALLDAVEAEQEQQALAARAVEEAAERARAEAEARRKAEEDLLARQEAAAREREALQAAIDKLERENAAVRAAAAATGAALPSEAVVAVPAPETEDEAARQLQTLLKGRGCYAGAIDGDFGRGSTRGLASFLKAAGSDFIARRHPPLDDLIAFAGVVRANPETRCPVQAVSRAPAASRPSAPSPPRSTTSTVPTSGGGSVAQAKPKKSKHPAVAHCNSKQFARFYQDCQQ